jgi:hypothetical protein
MGLLDDAIREHLDLKRRRGADPAEIERAEREALGPVRRRHEEPGGSLPESEPIADEDVQHDGMEEDWHEAMDQDWRGPIPEAGVAGTPEPLESDEFEAPDPRARWEDDDRFAGADPAGSGPASPPHSSLHGLEAETSEYDIAGEDEAEGEDVLEETPDFLQDTPDHDRLWFEQRPPRDFDFDG